MGNIALLQKCSFRVFIKAGVKDIPTLYLPKHNTIFTAYVIIYNSGGDNHYLQQKAGAICRAGSS